jgi:hypothetical protein
MKKNKIYFLACLMVFCSVQKKVFCADPWTGTSGTISGDKYIDSVINMTGLIELGGNLEIRSGGVLNTGSNSFSAFDFATLTINGGTINVQNSGSFLCNTNVTINSGTLALENGSTAVVPSTAGGGSGIICNGGTLDLQAGSYLELGSFFMTSNCFFNSGTFIHGGGDVAQGTGTSNFNLFGAQINGAALVPVGTKTLTIPSGQTMSIPAGSTFNIVSGSTLVNNGNVVLNYNSSLIRDGTFTNNGNFLDFSPKTVVIQPSAITKVPTGVNLDVAQVQDVQILGDFRNLSSGSINVYGNMYTYSLIENGGATAGTINIKPDGALYLLSGTLENKNAGSTITTERGGSLYNYYGTIDITTGGDTSFTMSAGAKFHNVRGNYLGNFTINTGGNFSDSNIVSLDRNLDIDYTWTITETATINGNGFEITLGTDGGIFVENGVSLLLKDIVLNDISGNKIDFADNTSTLSIDNVIFNQDANFSLTMAKIYVQGDWIINGNNYQFSYETNQASTIAAGAKMSLIFTTFKYDVSSNNLLLMTDATSSINLNRSTFYAIQDCSLQNGTLFVEGLGVLRGDVKLDLQNLAEINVTGAVQRIGNVVL